jgi:hypothetical protein
VHGPELLLSRGGLRGLGRHQGVRMDFRQRKVSPHIADPLLEALEQQLDRGGGLLAVRALEISVFHHRDGSMLRPQHMVEILDRRGELKGMIIHSNGLSLED